MAKPKTMAPAGLDEFQTIAWYWRKALSSSGEHRVAHLMMSSLVSTHGAHLLEGIAFNRELDIPVREYALPHGRLDLAIFHHDGSMSVIEIKDGAMGQRDVVAGIGQAVLYAVDAAMLPSRPRKIRRALAFSSTGCLNTDLRIEMACESAGVIPIHLGPTDALMRNVPSVFGLEPA